MNELRLRGSVDRTELFRDLFLRLSMQKPEFEGIIDSMATAGLVRQVNDVLTFTPRVAESSDHTNDTNADSVFLPEGPIPSTDDSES